MGNVPVIQEATTTLNSIGHLVVGDTKGAGECWGRYADKSVIGSGCVAIHHNIHGNKEACAKAREGCIRASCNIVAISRSIPLLHELSVASDALGDACMGDHEAARNRWSDYAENSICGAGVNSIVQKCHGNHEKAAELIAKCGKKTLNGVMEVAVVAVTIGTAGAAAPMGVGTAALCTAGATSVASTGAAVGTAAVDGRLNDLTAGEIVGAALNGAAAGALAGSLAARASAAAAAEAAAAEAAAVEAAEAGGATGASGAGSAAAESASAPQPSATPAASTASPAAASTAADLGVWAEYYDAPAASTAADLGVWAEYYDAPAASTAADLGVWAEYYEAPAASTAADLGVWAEYYDAPTQPTIVRAGAPNAGAPLPPPANYVHGGGPIEPYFDYHGYDQQLNDIANRVASENNTHSARLLAARQRKPIHEAQLRSRLEAKADFARRLGTECPEHNVQIARLQKCIAKDIAEIAEMSRVVSRSQGGSSALSS